MNRLVSLMLAVGLASGAPILWTIGANQTGVPNQLVKIDVGTSTVTAVVTLGDGTTSHAGGIVAGTTPGLFGGFQIDSMNNVALSLYSTAGAVLPAAFVGVFQPGGLTSAGGDFRWVENDALGNSTLKDDNLVQLSIALGDGFTGGLAHRSVNGLDYAIRNDTNGNSTLYSINTATSAVTLLPIVLGSGFYGGLAWDSATDQFYAIGSDSNANATLFRFALGDQAATPLFGIGQGFLYAALTVAPDASGEPGSDVPEPSAFVLAAMGAVALLLRKN